jgi:hypothetical protein
MLGPIRLQAGDLTRAILETVPEGACPDGLACALGAVSDHLLAGALVLGLCLVLGVVFALWFAALAARLDAPGAPRRGRWHAASAPMHIDGQWLRVVEDEQGDRIVEALHVPQHPSQHG